MGDTATNRYVGLLRGVNVGSGGPRVPMADLRRIVTGLGHTGVRTYLQSGNVVFDSVEQDTGRLAGQLGAALADQLGVDVPVLVRTGAELATVADGNPYAGAEDDPTRLLVAFLSVAPDPARVTALRVPAGDPARFTVVGREIYLHHPDGYGRTKFHNASLEKQLGVASTTRNWKSVRALAELAAAD
ncbi:MAG TPA: DUF1697 domain-containing protein [Micromonospora sp.]